MTSVKGSKSGCTSRYQRLTRPCWTGPTPGGNGTYRDTSPPRRRSGWSGTAYLCGHVKGGFGPGRRPGAGRGRAGRRPPCPSLPCPRVGRARVRGAPARARGPRAGPKAAEFPGRMARAEYRAPAAPGFPRRGREKPAGNHRREFRRFPRTGGRPAAGPGVLPPAGRGRPGAGRRPPVRRRTVPGRPSQVRPPAAGPRRRRSGASGNSCVLDGRRPAPPVRPALPAPRAGPAGAAAGGGNPGRRGREIGWPGISGIALDPFLSPWVTLSEPKVMHRALPRRWLTWSGQGRQRIDNEQGAKPHPH
ncbi:hypothetical protein EDD39_0300 [Kitasatospora cineracea]|uniref:Uncharacterized protein n=1 Tax=Kitasatospora cineracea TaxID=88074 RepID=A0A8G1X9J6_9ACTN|nr:hypothetical protein EDD39_0300 [Kitasatospora cineracea]